MQAPIYDTVRSLELEGSCTDIDIRKWNRLMKGATKGNKRSIDKLVKKHLPDLYDQLALQFYNPYNYRKTKTHLILIHSGIEFFLKINP